MEKPKKISKRIEDVRDETLSLVNDEQFPEETGEEDEMREAKLSNMLSVCR